LLSPATVIVVSQRRLWSTGLTLTGLCLIAVWFYGLHPSSPIPRQADESETSHSRTPGVPERWQQSVLSTRLAGQSLGHVLELLALTGGVFLLIRAVAGGRLSPVHFSRRSPGAIPTIPSGEVQRLLRPDGSELHMETRGSSTLPTVILIHGWSLNSDQWVYLQHEWQHKLRVVTWDLAGLGNSTQPANRDFSLEKMARDLEAVIEASGPGPVILLGHSIGGMVILKFCELFPELLGRRVSKLVLVHTTYTNPLWTMANSDRFVSLQKVLIEPLLHLQILFSPFMWVMDYLSYLDGSIHRSLRRTGFAGTETRSQLDFIASFYAQDSPAVLARGALAMLAYDSTRVLSEIRIPVLVVGGEQDPITGMQASREMASRLVCGRLVVLDPAKHFGLIEHYREFARQSAAFCLEDREVSSRNAGSWDSSAATNVGLPESASK
jgi:pimeloyl-ACP methyl ester carboxylesterase